MTPFSGQAILLDIEGTTSSISYIYDTMFPYVRQHLAEFLRANWHRHELVDAVAQLAVDADVEPQTWLAGMSPQEAQQQVVEHVQRLMDGDAKSTGLKQLQGLIWKAGFESHELTGHLFPDVASALRSWKRCGVKIYIYSSGSIAAQKLYFGFSQEGNLLPLIDGHFDTSAGNKRESASYHFIARAIGLPEQECLFVSDNVDELNAARSAGMSTLLSVRPGNPPTPSVEHDQISDFMQIECATVAR
ncbi:MAG TPA: acireductone synthase [Pirellulaceae bacterium]|nr:acireductone synthase [Pirellulaceae bacterium]HMO90814.1 acireductone synthase [Pirellulaceae bacterium]HMP68065.1 acireductone synthase [Pirellulaceae bacterium]